MQPFVTIDQLNALANTTIQVSILSCGLGCAARLRVPAPDCSCWHVVLQEEPQIPACPCPWCQTAQLYCQCLSVLLLMMS